MSLPTNKTPADFPFKHTGQADAFGNDKGGNVPVIQGDFDERAIYNQTQINEILNALKSILLGDDGALTIGINAVGITANNVNAAIAEVQANVAGATLGLIPDNSLTESKMVDAMKKQAGGVAEFDTVTTNTTNIGTNATNIGIIEDELDIVRTAKDSTGTLDAYILDTPATFDYTIDGNLVNFSPNFTNAGSATISIDGTTKAIKKPSGSTFIILSKNDIKEKHTTKLRYNVSESCFVLSSEPPNITISTLDAFGGNDGDIWIKYTP